MFGTPAPLFLVGRYQRNPDLFLADVAAAASDPAGVSLSRVAYLYLEKLAGIGPSEMPVNIDTLTVSGDAARTLLGLARAQAPAL